MKNDINDLYYQLKFLSELTSIVLERFELDEVNGRLLKAEEQNRIASEIHDGVLQRLFSISCGIFTLMKRKKKAPNEDITEELNQMRSSIDDTMKELRKTIYGLSWSKEGSDNFISDINNYIDEIKRLTTINIKFKVQGKSEVLSTLHKKAFYRVIREGISNGIRHGGAKNIDINLYIYRQQTLLEIIDDGTGFDIKEIRNKKDKGIGIENMYHLVNSLKGQIYFDSIKERGTIISIKVPNVHVIEREEVV
nr:histidine kinase [Anaeromonas frigoriresistens]